MITMNDPRWPKQLGDFGEQLVMYVIGRQKNMKVALVDHAGADIIASDLNNKNNRYAISVKSHAVGVKISNGKVMMESKAYPFDGHNVDELSKFADAFALRPAVSMVIVQPIVDQSCDDWNIRKRRAENAKTYFEPHEQLVIDVFTFSLEDAQTIINESKPYITANKRYGGFNFKFENRYFNELTHDKRIDHVRLRFDPFSNIREWDQQHPMNTNAVQQTADQE